MGPLVRVHCVREHTSLSPNPASLGGLDTPLVALTIRNQDGHILIKAKGAGTVNSLLKFEGH